MQDFQTYLAPAKINLFLHITGVREDGYHLLQTVFQLLDFYDDIHLKVTQNGEIKRINTVAGVPEETDLCVRAAQLLQKVSNTPFGVEIKVDKHIPMGGGLGGGSSDAATVLLALNRLWKLNLNRTELMELGLKLGADVPFFIFGKNAWAEGIGEQLKPIVLMETFYVVLNPSVHVATGQIFANKQLTKNAIPKTMSDFSGLQDQTDINVAEDFESQCNVKSDFINVLEKCVCDEYPQVFDCLQWLKQFGDARMTGSGASIFLEVASKKSAMSILKQKPPHVFGFVAKGLNQHPLFNETH